jgi:hypothetical protein
LQKIWPFIQPYNLTMFDEIAKQKHANEEAHVLQTASNFSSKLLQPIRINETRVTPDVIVFIDAYLYIFRQISNFSIKKNNCSYTA